MLLRQLFLHVSFQSHPGPLHFSHSVFQISRSVCALPTLTPMLLPACVLRLGELQHPLPSRNCQRPLSQPLTDGSIILPNSAFPPEPVHFSPASPVQTPVIRHVDNSQSPGLPPRGACPLPSPICSHTAVTIIFLNLGLNVSLSY